MAESSPSVWLKWASAQLKDSETSQQKRTLIIALAATASVAAGIITFRSFLPKKLKVIGVIPVRWGSSRFRGKPLAQIAGKPLIQRTWENAKLARTLDRVVIATDDDRIAECCKSFGAEVIMTSQACMNGSERCAEVVQKLKSRYDIVVNIEGDEVLLEPDAVDAVVLTLERRPEAVAATASADLQFQLAADPNRVKCVVDDDGYALYFSRALIPSNKNGTPCKDFPYMLHVGLQAFRSSFLQQYVKMKPTPLETEEQLELLRILESGNKLAVVKVRYRGHGVDVPADLKRVEDALQQHDLSGRHH